MIILNLLLVVWFTDGHRHAWTDEGRADYSECAVLDEHPDARVFLIYGNGPEELDSLRPRQKPKGMSESLWIVRNMAGSATESTAMSKFVCGQRKRFNRPKKETP